MHYSCNSPTYSKEEIQNAIFLDLGDNWNQWHSLKMATMEGMTLHIYLQHNKTYIVQTPPLLPSVSSHLKTALKWISLKKNPLLPVLMVIWI